MPLLFMQLLHHWVSSIATPVITNLQISQLGKVDDYFSSNGMYRPFQYREICPVEMKASSSVLDEFLNILWLTCVGSGMTRALPSSNGTIGKNIDDIQ